MYVHATPIIDPYTDMNRVSTVSTNFHINNRFSFDLVSYARGNNCRIPYIVNIYSNCSDRRLKAIILLFYAELIYPIKFSSKPSKIFIIHAIEYQAWRINSHIFRIFQILHETLLHNISTTLQMYIYNIY